MFDRPQRIQRREFRDYQPLFMLINSLDIIDEATRRDFVCMQGPVWRRYNEATKGAKERRITVLFLGDADNSFEELLLVGCDFVRRRQRHCQRLWSRHPLGSRLDDAAVHQLCCGLAGRSVITWKEMDPWLQTLGPEPSSSPESFVEGHGRSLYTHVPALPGLAACRGGHALG